jgi:hypothetical protein
MSMIRQRVGWAAVLAFAIAPVLVPGAAAQDLARDALRRDIDFARSKVYPALVNISVVVSPRPAAASSSRPPGTC